MPPERPVEGTKKEANTMKRTISQRITVVLGACAIATTGMLTACTKTETAQPTPSSSAPAVVTTEKAVAPAPQSPNDGWGGRSGNGGRTDTNDQGSQPNKSEPDMRGPVGWPQPQIGNN